MITVQVQETLEYEVDIDTDDPEEAERQAEQMDMHAEGNKARFISVNKEVYVPDVY